MGEAIDHHAGVSNDPLTSPVLAPRYYTDPEVFEREKSAVFYASWIYVCHTSELAEPGDMVPRRILDEPVVVVRNRDGEVKAFFNVCAHRAMEVVAGSGCRTVLQCPYHGWVYDLDGRLVSARRTNHLQDFKRSNVALQPVRVAEVDSFIFINIDGEAPPANEVLAPMIADARSNGIDPAQLKKTRHIDYEIEANWKVVIDNYVESYHTEVAHPGFCDYANFDSAFVEDGPWHTLMGGPSTDNVLDEYRRTGRLDVAENRYNWTWPSTMMLFSSGPMNLFIWEVIPMAFDRTIFRHTFFFDLDADDLLTEQREHMEMDGSLQAEDTRLVEGVWRGLRSRAASQGGRYVVNDAETQHSERAVWRFQRRLQDIYDGVDL